jgi:hypothetical protein
MRINKGLLGWGVFLIVLGLEALAIRGGLVDAGLARRALEVWPIILVAIGVDLILKRTPAAPLGTIAVSLVFALMAGGLIATTPIAGRGTGVCGGVTAGVDGSAGMGPTSVPNGGTLGSEASVTIVADCGTVRINGASGSDYKLAWGGGDSLAPNVDASASRLALRRHTVAGVSVGAPAIDWTVTLPRDPVLRLDFQLNAGSMTAGLGGLRVSEFAAAVNAGEAKIDLSEAAARDIVMVNGSANAGSLSIALPAPVGTLAGALHVNAGTIRLCVPAAAGLRIRVDGEALASNNFADRGLTNADNTWTRSGWDTSSPSRIDLVVTANLGTITLDPEEGCG